jgi:hypothetical protein
MEREDQLTYSQVPSTGSCPEPDEYKINLGKTILDCDQSALCQEWLSSFFQRKPVDICP